MALSDPAARSAAIAAGRARLSAALVGDPQGESTS